MKRSGASDEQIAIRVFQYQIAGSYIGSVSIMQQQVDTLLNSGVSVETVIRALSMKKGRRLTNDEIGLIKNRYSVMLQKLERGRVERDKLEMLLLSYPLYHRVNKVR